MKHIYTLALIAYFISFSTYINSQNALHFDGSNDYVQTTFDGVFGTNNRTFEAWVKVDVGASASNLCIVDYGMNAIGSRNTFSVKGDRGLAYISGGTLTNISSPANGITEGQWTHVAFVLNNGTGFLYINGVQVGTGSLANVNTPSNGTDLRIGERVTGGSIPFEGAIDEVRIWDVARTPAELLNNRNAEFCTVPPNLVAYYTCNQGIAGGNNNNLTNLHNAVLNANGTLNNFSLSGTTSNWVSGASLTLGLTVSKNNETVCDSLVSPSGNFTWTSSGSYYDTVQNANGCDSIMRFGLTVNNGIYQIVNDSSCEPYMSPSGNYTYTASGQYFDTTQTSQGCDHVYELNLTLNILDTTLTVSPSTLTSNEANATYSWLDCNNDFAPISGANSQSFSPPSNGTYAVRVENGQCADTSECIAMNFVGINQSVRRSDILIYPNPVSNTLFISGAVDIENLNVEVLSSVGEVIIRKKKSESIDVTNLSPGLYWIQVLEGDKVSTKTFVKK